MVTATVISRTSSLPVPRAIMLVTAAKNKEFSLVVLRRAGGAETYSGATMAPACERMIPRKNQFGLLTFYHLG